MGACRRGAARPAPTSAPYPRSQSRYGPTGHVAHSRPTLGALVGSFRIPVPSRRSAHEARPARSQRAALPRDVPQRARPRDRGGGWRRSQAQPGRARLRRPARRPRGHARHHGRPAPALHARCRTAGPASGGGEPVRLTARRRRGPAQHPHNGRRFCRPAAGHRPDDRERRRRRHGRSLLPVQPRARRGLRRPSRARTNERGQSLPARRPDDDAGMDLEHERDRARHTVEPDRHDDPLRRARPHLPGGPSARGMADRR